MGFFWTTGIMILAGGFALLLILNPNMSWTVKRLPNPIRPLFSVKKKKAPLKTEDYGFDLSDELNLPDQKDKP